MSKMTYLWLSGVFFQALNTQKIVFGRILPIPFPLDAFGVSVVRPQHKFLATPMAYPIFSGLPSQKNLAPPVHL